MLTLFPHIVGISFVTAAVLIFERQLAGKDGVILEYFVIIAGRCQVRRVKVGVTVVKPNAWQLVLVEMNINPCDLKRRISDDNKELLDDMSSRRALLPEEALVNHRFEFIQYIVIFSPGEFLFLLTKPRQFSLNFSYSTLNFGRSKSFV